MRFAPWTAAWFCAALSVIVMVSDLGIAFMNRQPSQLGQLTTFLAFLPMCFYFLGMLVAKQQKEIQELRMQLEALKLGARN